MAAHVLIVDDNADNRKLLVWLLEDHGMSSEEADSAEMALDMLQDRSFDAILMDISLPGMSGSEATMLLRRQPAYATLPIIAVTAHAIKGEAEKIMNSGVSALVTKPVDEDQLMDVLTKLLKAKDS